jgi:adenosine deaminase
MVSSPNSPRRPRIPLDRLRGVRLSIITDDPSLRRTNLPREYEMRGATYGWIEDVLRDLARTSIKASFAGPDTRRRGAAT